MVLRNTQNEDGANSRKGEFDTASGVTADPSISVRRRNHQDLSGGRTPEEIELWHQQQRDCGGCRL